MGKRAVKRDACPASLLEQWGPTAEVLRSGRWSVREVPDPFVSWALVWTPPDAPAWCFVTSGDYATMEEMFVAVSEAWPLWPAKDTDERVTASKKQRRTEALWRLIVATSQREVV